MISENDITPGNLHLLEDSDARELIPPIGPRREFLKKLEAYKASASRANDEVNANPAPDTVASQVSRERQQERVDRTWRQADSVLRVH